MTLTLGDKTRNLRIRDLSEDLERTGTQFARQLLLESPPLRTICKWMITGVFMFAVLTKSSAVAATTPVPSKQQVLTCIANTIDWYRHLPTTRQMGTEPADLVFLEDNRPTVKEIVRLSFDFGRAVAAIEQNSPNPELAPDSTDLRDLSAAKAQLDQGAQQASDQLKSLTQAKLAAHGADRKKFDTEMAEIQTRIKVLSAMSANYQSLLGVARNTTASERVIRMEALVENLERTVPDVAAAAPPALQTPNLPAESSGASHGIMDTISRISALTRKEQFIDKVIKQTDELNESLRKMRTLFIEPLRKQFSTLSLHAKSLDALQRQQFRLTDLVAQAQTVAPAIAALDKQRVLLKLYSAHLTERRSEIRTDHRASWKMLLVHLGLLGGEIAILLAISAIVHMLTFRQVHNSATRQMILVTRRILLWLMIVIVVLFAFAFDVSSLLTLVGLLFAGLTVGLRDVLLAIGGYLLLVGKYHIRVGDRVQVATVTGEVTNLGLMELELTEMDIKTGERTGRVVFFSTCYVFGSPSTPLFKQISTST